MGADEVRESPILYNRAMKPVAAAWTLALVAALALALPARAAEEAKAKRLALVIGNGAYKDAPLSNPPNDAADMAKALEASGFTVIHRDNATLKEMHLALREFGDKLGRRDTGLFYFAGHGMQVRGHNYLLPVDADIAREDEVAFAALDLGAVMDKLDSAKNPVNIVILDACRNNPFGAKLAVSTRGLAQVDAPPGTLIAFATSPGSTAADGAGRNGLYTGHLVKEIARPGAPIEEVLKAVRVGVRTDSKNLQTPWESTSLEASFAFHEAPAPAKRPEPLRVASAVPSAARAAAPVSLGAPPAFAVGDTWTYRVVNLLDQSERNATFRIAAIREDIVEYSNGALGDLAGNFVKTNRNGRIDDFKPSNQFYVFPMRSGGQWNLKAFQKSGERGIDIQVKLTVATAEEIDTPAGKLPGLKITREAQWKTRNGTSSGVNTWTYWYNSAVKRFIAADNVNVTAEGKVLTRERFELASFNVR
jgi:hypothetical protein